MEDDRRDKAMRKKYKLYAGLLVVLLLIADQTTKFFAMHFFGTEKKIVLLESILELNYTENTGAAFGVFEGYNMLITLIVIALVIFLLIKYYKLSQTGKYYGIRLSMLVLISGAIGNLIDRLRYGFVIDFIYFIPIDFPKFNCADMCIVLSVIVIGYLFLFVYSEEDISYIFK